MAINARKIAAMLAGGQQPCHDGDVARFGRDRQTDDPRRRRRLQFPGIARAGRLRAPQRGRQGRARRQSEHALCLRRGHALAVDPVGLRPWAEHHRPDQPSALRHRGAGQPRIRFRAGQLHRKGQGVEISVGGDQHHQCRRLAGRRPRRRDGQGNGRPEDRAGPGGAGHISGSVEHGRPEIPADGRHRHRRGESGPFGRRGPRHRRGADRHDERPQADRQPRLRRDHVGRRPLLCHRLRRRDRLCRDLDRRASSFRPST